MSIIFCYHWRPLPYSTITEFCPNVPRLNNNSKSLSIAKDACNSVNQTNFVIQFFFGLTSIKVESNNFKYTNSFVLDTLPKLEELQIGDSCFEGVSSQNNFRFSISNCSHLTSVSIGKRSFSQYYDSFEIRECPSLERVVLQGFNFRSSSLVLDGIYIVSVIF